MTRMEDTLTTEVVSKMTKEELVDKLIHYKQLYETTAEEFDEYKASSLEMEQMLEKELQEAEKGRRNAETEREYVRRELDRITERYEVDKREAISLEETLRNELSSVKSALEEARGRIRLLEQANDDLERRDRYQEQMLEDLTKNLEHTMERAAILESELAEQQFQSESAMRTREETRSERPRVAVEPLRVERLAEHTPEETPEKERKAFAAMAIDDTHMEVDDSHPCTSSSVSSIPPHQLPLTPDSSTHNDLVDDPSKATSLRKPSGFTHSINRIVKDLLVRVDRVENILTTLKSTPR